MLEANFGKEEYLSVKWEISKYAYDDTYDTAILVSGDGDFAAAVNAVKDRGKHVEHAYLKLLQP